MTNGRKDSKVPLWKFRINRCTREREYRYIINLSDGVNVVNYLRLQLFVFAPTSKQLMYTINIQIITRLIAAEF